MFVHADIHGNSMAILSRDAGLMPTLTRAKYQPQLKDRRGPGRYVGCMSDLSMDGRVVAYHVVDGYGEPGFGSGEGASETATTSKEGSRRANTQSLCGGRSDET